MPLPVLEILNIEFFSLLDLGLKYLRLLFANQKFWSFFLFREWRIKKCKLVMRTTTSFVFSASLITLNEGEQQSLLKKEALFSERSYFR